MARVMRASSAERPSRASRAKAARAQKGQGGHGQGQEQINAGADGDSQKRHGKGQPPMKAPGKTGKVNKQENKSKLVSKGKNKSRERKPDSKVQKVGRDANPEEEKPQEKKPKKKAVPSWSSSAKVADKKAEAKSDISVLREAMEKSANPRGIASFAAIQKYFAANCPTWSAAKVRKTMLKALDQKDVKQVTGKGLSGSFKLTKVAGSSGKKVTKAKEGSGPATPKIDRPLEEYFPNIFTWVSEPKATSGQHIKMYLSLYHSLLDSDTKGLKAALDSGVRKGQLYRLSGQGLSGTFQLVDGAKKTGTRWENAIENAIIATNEPKEASVRSLVQYLSEFHTEYNVAENPKVLMRALDRAEKSGWVKRLTGKGMTGSYRLMNQYHPAPRELWGDWYERDETEVDGTAIDANNNKVQAPEKKKNNGGKPVRMSASK